MPKNASGFRRTSLRVSSEILFFLVCQLILLWCFYGKFDVRILLGVSIAAVFGFSLLWKLLEKRYM